MKVVNVRTCGHFNYVLCDRTTPLGNPFTINAMVSRDEVIKLFEEYFPRVLKGEEPNEVASELCYKYWVDVSNYFFGQRYTSQQVQKQFNSLKDDTLLGCHCKPKACHCDVLVELKTNTEDNVMMDLHTLLISIEQNLQQANTGLEQLRQLLSESGANAAVQQAQTEALLEQPAAAAVANADNTFIIKMSHTTAQSGASMLRGVGYLANGTPEPYELPVVMFETRNGKSNFSGNVGERDATVGKLWLYINDNGSSISCQIECGNDVDGGYKGPLMSDASNEYDYVATLTKEVAKAPVLTGLTKSLASNKQQLVPNQNVNQTMFPSGVSDIHEEEVQPKRNVRPLVSRLSQ